MQAHSTDSKSLTPVFRDSTAEEKANSQLGKLEKIPLSLREQAHVWVRETLGALQSSWVGIFHYYLLKSSQTPAHHSEPETPILPSAHELKIPCPSHPSPPEEPAGYLLNLCRDKPMRLTKTEALAEPPWATSFKKTI